MKMKVTVIGKAKVDYVSKRTNQQVSGVTLHVTREDNNVSGLAVETIFISAKANVFKDADSVKLGDNVNVSYNRYGSVDSITLCK